MPTLTVTSRGQVTFRREVLRHLGIRPGEKIELEALPNGELRLRAARGTGGIEGFLGLLAGRSRRRATLEEIERAAADGWASHS